MSCRAVGAASQSRPRRPGASTEQPVGRSVCRAIARQTMAFYLPLPNYRHNWLRLGFSEQDLADGGSDRFLDAMVAWGELPAIQQRLQDHFDAGASHVCLQALHPDGQPMPDLEALAALAP